MNNRVFLDTNVLVYAADLDAGEKNHVARELLDDAMRSRVGVLSTQVLQEFYVISTSKLGIEPEHARRQVELLSTLEVVEIQVGMILAAIDLCRLHSFSFWDALILRAASDAGCRRVLTENMQHARDVDGLRIENPFSPDS